ncbi:MAG: ATP-grasp domain-containing protein [Hyphomicrobium sp.]
MKLHEFQTKRLLSDFGLTSPSWGVAITPEEAEAIATNLPASTYIVKAQVHASHRSRLLGAHVVDSPAEARKVARDLLGQQIATDDGGLSAQTIKRVMIETAVRSEDAIALTLFVHPSTADIVISGHNRGADGFGRTDTQQLSLGTGRMFPEFDVTLLAVRLRVPDNARTAFAALVDGLLRAFMEFDASRIEIDPLAIMPDGSFFALSARLVIDDNALFRQPAVRALQGTDELELSAQRHQFNYLRLDGDIGLAANGTGLGLATLDMVRAANGRPANFMDIRATATSVDIAYGFELILDNPNVRSILVNVHGGGMQACDTVADGLDIAMRRTGRSLPTIVRVAGNNAEFARDRFKALGCRTVDCDDMWSAAEQAVAAAA